MIVAVLISGVLLWHFYPAGTTVVSDEEIELKFWQSVEKTGTQESYCAYFEKYPNGEFAVLAEQKCHPKNSNSNFVRQTIAPVQQENIVDYTKLKQAVGMTKNQVKEQFGTPSFASDDTFGYYVIQPDTGKQTMCGVYFGGYKADPNVVGKVDC